MGSMPLKQDPESLLSKEVSLSRSQFQHTHTHTHTHTHPHTHTQYLKKDVYVLKTQEEKCKFPLLGFYLRSEFS